MRLHHCVRMLAAAATLAVASAPAAQASAIDGGGGGSEGTVARVQQHIAPRHSSSTDWELIAIAGGGTVALLGAGLGGSRRRTRRPDSAGDVRAAGVS